MIKMLFLSMLLRLGWWVDKPEAWVQKAIPPEIVKTACRNALPGFPGTIWKKAAEKTGVDPLMLYSICLLESSKRRENNNVGPWPFALHFNDANVSIYAGNIKEAKYVLDHVTTDNVDIGLGQVNYKSHKDKVRCPEELLDPEINLTVAGKILAEAICSTPDPELGIGRYHSWTELRARAYGKKVLAIHEAIKDFVKRKEIILANDEAING